LEQGTQCVLKHLYDLLLGPLEAELQVEKVVMVPYGVLHGLPLHALYSGTHYALDRWEFVYAPSAAVWYAGANRGVQPGNDALRDAMSHALIMGIPDQGIEHVQDEVEQLAGHLPNATVFCDTEATVGAFMEHASASRLIHLATHALFRDDNPLFSGLQFSDGWLLARDLYEQNLNCELVTLSACRTGVSSVEAGDELFGLMRGFLSAGVRSLAVSMWPTDDAATAELMSLFYTNMAQGVSKSAALRTAQRQLRNRWPHPYHWAAFALVGDR
jgi:CHAT domain-containing protein